jgi:hypothetical protein
MRHDFAQTRVVAFVEIGTDVERDSRAAATRAAAQANSEATGRHLATIVQPLCVMQPGADPEARKVTRRRMRDGGPEVEAA